MKKVTRKPIQSLSKLQEDLERKLADLGVIVPKFPTEMKRRDLMRLLREIEEDLAQEVHEVDPFPAT